MTTPEEQLAKLRHAYDLGIIDRETYEKALAGFGVSVSGSQVGVIGDRTTVEGGRWHRPGGSRSVRGAATAITPDRAETDGCTEKR